MDDQPHADLVPKLRLGMHIRAKLCFAWRGVRGRERPVTSVAVCFG